jgi:hypothetical protein
MDDHGGALRGRHIFGASSDRSGEGAPCRGSLISDRTSIDVDDRTVGSFVGGNIRRPDAGAGFDGKVQRFSYVASNEFNIADAVVRNDLRRDDQVLQDRALTCAPTFDPINESARTGPVRMADDHARTAGQRCPYRASPSSPARRIPNVDHGSK